MAKPRITDEAAIEAIYAAACAPERWTVALDRIADCFDAEGTALVFQRNERDFAALISPAIAAAGLEYSERWGKDDPRAKAVRQLFQEGHAAVTDSHICTAEEIESQPYYTEFLAKHGLGWFMATEVSPDPGLLVALSVQRAKHKGAFTDGELARLVPLGRHAEQALRISVRLMWSEAAHRTLGEALAKLSCGVFLLDSMHRVQFSNSAAAELIGDVFDIVDGQLCRRDALPQSSGSVATSQFLMRRGLPVPPDLPKPYLLKGRKSRTPRLVHIIPYQAATDSAAQAMFATACTIVLVVEPSVAESLEPAVVRDLLGLTLGEARVAALVGAGKAPRAAATELGISEATARTVLKRVFSKTGVSRQSELASMLGRLAQLAPE